MVVSYFFGVLGRRAFSASDAEQMVPAGTIFPKLVPAGTICSASFTKSARRRPRVPAGTAGTFYQKMCPRAPFTQRLSGDDAEQ